ncbi:YSIRK-type signal peptide-containing protein [Mucilaginibacter aquariorum]
MKQTGYSLRKLFTGLASAALTD